MNRADDAIWRPGFEGDVMHVPPSDATAERVGPSASSTIEMEVDEHRPTLARRPGDGPRRWPRSTIAGAIVVLVAVSGVAVWQLRDGSDGGTGPRMPAAIARQWANTLQANQVTAVAGTSDTIVAALDWDPRLFALDLSTGEQRWVVEAPRGQLQALEIVEGVVVSVAFDGGDQTSEMMAVDLRSGRFLWSRSVVSATVDDDRILATTTDHFVGRITSVEMIEPRSGQTVATIRGDEIAIDRQVITSRTGPRIAVHDAVTFRRVAELDATGLRGAPSVLVTDHGVVYATATQLRVADRDGNVMSALDLPLLGDRLTWGDAFLTRVGKEGTMFLAERYGRVAMFTIADDDELTLRWDRPAQLIAAPDGDHLVALMPITQDGSSVGTSPSGGVRSMGSSPTEIVDARTGETRWTIAAASPDLDRPPSSADMTSTGLVSTTTIGRDDRSSQTIATGHDLDGHEVWRLAMPNLVSVHLADRQVVTFELDTAAARVVVSSWG